MTPSDRTKEINQFVNEYFDSVEQLEVLLLLRDHQNKEWTAAAVSNELRSAPESVAKRLHDLHAKKFLILKTEQESLYRYQPQTERLTQLMDDLAQAYRVRRFSIINLIFSKPPDVIRNFAEAFKIKKDDGSENDG